MFLFKLMELYIFETDEVRYKWTHLRRTNFRTNLSWTSFGRIVKIFSKNIETRPVVLWHLYTISFRNDKIFLVMYKFVPRTRIPKFKKKKFL
jgi:hypothetical protein